MEKLSKPTQLAIRALAELTEQQFMNRYSVSKATYRKRLVKYGDPYLYSPLAIIGKWLLAKGFGR